MSGKIGDAISDQDAKTIKIKGRVVVMKKNVLAFNDFNSSFVDTFDELVGTRVCFQLIGSQHPDPSEKGSKGKLGSPAYLEDWIATITVINPGESAFDITFDWDEAHGVPGAFVIKNFYDSEFYLKTLTLLDVPGNGDIQFICNSWVYPVDKYTMDRVFFSNNTYLPSETPGPLIGYREEELANLRGSGTGMRLEWDRVYDYDFYNDLGDPDRNIKTARPVLGGSTEFPYPRRGRTGRPPTQTDPATESRLPRFVLDIYVPRDESFGHLKESDFLYFGLRALVQFLLPAFEAIFDSTPNEFDTFDDVLKLYEGGFKLPEGPLLDNIRKNIPPELLNELIRIDAQGFAKFPMPAVIKEDLTAWRTDEEFAREMLAGMNPVSIALLREYPPKSKLNVEVYGNQDSSITKFHIHNQLDGLTVDEAMETNRLFILDHHDALMPYLSRINASTKTIYATRTLLFLQNDGTLKPLVIELSLPHPEGDEYGAINKVYTPAAEGTVEGSIWQLAKAYVAVNDQGVHQLVSHWLNTHASIEPFIIATNRHLSVLHPVHRLLHPHFRDTMNLNASGRQILANAGGIIELTMFPGKYSMEMSSAVYKSWVFPEQALPADLIKRGMAIEDCNSPHGLRLLIEDYPYANDGLDIWSAIKTWVTEYCNLYYKTDDMVQNDNELQRWWTEVREVGHGDKKNEGWWPKMQTCQELIDSCTIIIWVASALHAAINFGQYEYAGYIPNRPTLSRRPMPEPDTPEYEELKTDPDGVFLKTITPQLTTLLDMATIEILATHPTDEVYLGQRDNPDWTKDTEALEAFERFNKKLEDVAKNIDDRNKDGKNKNRNGLVKIPYTLLYPTSEPGRTGKGIPNSISM
ncbi:probable linoleate 9S-lipoxygenase 5 [Daucus carota subsp. sativus]|uniref:probable linoleate 9S-lipoxygenase 5 n=1 Tax=Daucus carota subsp. sativus TaxID=79200 RepID=UPI0007EF11D6|nr:PREDICTED: probable linoleate 9S-lipoxygenase 5 [Daucus carota subsp. sativus]